jgi:hypothetical protein
LPRNAGVPLRLAHQDCTGSLILASRQPSPDNGQIPPPQNLFRQAGLIARRAPAPSRLHLAQIVFENAG